MLESVASQCAVQFDFTPEGIAFKRMFERKLLPIPEVNSRIAHELNGLTFAYPRAADADAAVGLRVPDVDLVTQAGEVRIGELLRARTFLLIDLTGDAAFDSMNTGALPVTTVSGVPVLTPPSLEGLTSLLIRPDGYVAWAGRAGTSQADAWRALSEWILVPENAYSPIAEVLAEVG